MDEWIPDDNIEFEKLTELITYGSFRNLAIYKVEEDFNYHFADIFNQIKNVVDRKKYLMEFLDKIAMYRTLKNARDGLNRLNNHNKDNSIALLNGYDFGSDKNRIRQIEKNKKSAFVVLESIIQNSGDKKTEQFFDLLVEYIETCESYIDGNNENRKLSIKNYTTEKTKKSHIKEMLKSFIDDNDIRITLLEINQAIEALNL